MEKKEIRYPILFCEVRGRISTPTKPRKGQRTIPKPKIRTFKDTIPVKVYPYEEGDELVPTSTKSVYLQGKYGIDKKDTVYYDKIVVLRSVGDTRIKD